MEKLLAHRKKIKAKKPVFVRKDQHRKQRLTKGWRRPKGLQNKLRLRKRGYGRHVEIGWGSPKLVKGFHESGLEPILINNVFALGSIDVKKQGIIVAGTVGDKKRSEIIEKAMKANITILNHDGKKSLEGIKAKLDQRKKIKKEKQEKKSAKKKADKPKEEKPKAKPEAEKTEEEKLKEKKERDKLLTKKE